MSGAIERNDDVELYRAAIPGADITVCLLTAGVAALIDRALKRGQGLAAPLPGDALRGLCEARLRQIAAAAAEQSTILERSTNADLHVPTDARSIGEIARLIHSRAVPSDEPDPRPAP